MSACVLDASFTLQWLFRDEASDDGYAALTVVVREGATVPHIWFSEVVNALILAERRGRIEEAETDHVLREIQFLPLDVDEANSLHWSMQVVNLMRTHRLTAYDATYLELAQRRGLPLASLDRRLNGAAQAAGVPVFAVPG